MKLPYEAVSHQEEMTQNLEASINELPVADKDLILMHYTSGLSLKEIALITQTNLTNLKVRLHRIRKRLYQKLQPKAAENL